MTPLDRRDPHSDLQREALLHSLHPAVVRQRARRWRWIRVAMAVLVTAVLYGVVIAAQRATLHATADGDPVGLLIGAALAFMLSLCVGAVLLGLALAAEVIHLLHRDR